MDIEARRQIEQGNLDHLKTAEMGCQGKNGKLVRFFWNQSRATSSNVYLLLYPRGALKGALRSRLELYPDVLEFLQAIAPGHLIGGSRVYGVGLHKMEPKELAGLPAVGLAEAVETPPAEEQLTFL
jgi:adenine-specific DNA-methyltransferase